MLSHCDKTVRTSFEQSLVTVLSLTGFSKLLITAKETSESGITSIFFTGDRAVNKDYMNGYVQLFLGANFSYSAFSWWWKPYLYCASLPASMQWRLAAVWGAGSDICSSFKRILHIWKIGSHDNNILRSLRPRATNIWRIWSLPSCYCALFSIRELVYKILRSTNVSNNLTFSSCFGWLDHTATKILLQLETSFTEKI